MATGKEAHVFPRVGNMFHTLSNVAQRFNLDVKCGGRGGQEESKFSQREVASIVIWGAAGLCSGLM